MEENASRKATVHSNIGAISKKLSTGYEWQLCELADLASVYADEAAELMSSGVGAAECFIILSEDLHFVKAAPCDGVLPKNESRVSVFLRGLTSFEKAAFSELYIEALAEKGIIVNEKMLLGTSVTDETMTYVKNYLADEAYDVFSQELADPRVAYAKDIKEAASAVCRGVVGYAILPLEEGGDYRIPGISSTLYANDLKILAVTPVFGFDGNADIKYALVSSGFSIMPYNEDDDRYLEILIQTEARDLQDTLLAAEMFGIDLYRANSVSFEADAGKEYYYSLIFRRQGGDFSDILTYLTLFVSEYIPMGIYNNLE